MIIGIYHNFKGNPKGNFKTNSEDDPEDDMAILKDYVDEFGYYTNGNEFAKLYKKRKRK